MDKTIEQIKQNGIENYVRTTFNAKHKIKKLMKKYATAYYEGSALISDLDFEVLIDTLKYINSADKYLTTPGWGYKIKHGKKHIYGKVGTLPYFYEYKDIISLFNSQKVIITPKFDGINYVAYYKNGKFKICATRGNGKVGKNISWAYNNDLKISQALNNKTFAINGEVILQQPLTQQRDTVANYLNKKKQKNTNIIFMPFCLFNTNLDYLAQIQKIQNFNIHPPFLIFEQLPSNKELTNLFDNFKREYQIDGLVLTTPDKSTQIAFKFKNN